LDQTQGSNVWLTLGLREGKNREVRNILSALNLTVNRLIRVSFGPFQLLDLDVGDVEHVRRRVLADQLGPDVARQFHLVEEADDEAPPPGKTGRGAGPAQGRAPRDGKPKERR
jgi:23S rRNA pseudouridine2605 synthase